MDKYRSWCGNANAWRLPFRLPEETGVTPTLRLFEVGLKGRKMPEDEAQQLEKVFEGLGSPPRAEHRQSEALYSLKELTDLDTALPGIRTERRLCSVRPEWEGGHFRCPLAPCLFTAATPAGVLSHLQNFRCHASYWPLGKPVLFAVWRSDSTIHFLEEGGVVGHWQVTAV